MKQDYRKAYLTDGTQVKITEELYQKLRQLEQEGYTLPFEYTDMLKKEDYDMIRANRTYYLHNTSLDAHDADSPMLRDIYYSLDDHVIQRECGKLVMNVLSLCSDTQRRRFIKHYYLGFSFAEIARQESCYESAVRKSVGKAEKMIVSKKTLL
jgi:DNA-directed RNA polymerase specialized sigma24 family protein